MTISFVFGLFILGYYPTLHLLVVKWAGSDEYTHAFLMVPVIGFMWWRKRSLMTGSPGRSAKAGLVFAVCSMIIYAVSLRLQIPTISFLSMLMTIISCLVYLVGHKMITRNPTPLLLLLLIIPIPNDLYSMVTLPLQLQASQLSEQIVRWSGVPLFREGNVLHLAEKSFQVVETCSGLRSMMTLLTLSLVIGHFMLRKFRSKSLLVAASIPVAFLINIIRVVGMVLVFHFLGLDISTGKAHTIAGLGIFLVGLFLLFTLQRILETWETEKKQNLQY